MKKFIWWMIFCSAVVVYNIIDKFVIRDVSDLGTWDWISLFFTGLIILSMTANLILRIRIRKENEKRIEYLERRMELLKERQEIKK